ncbi:MAG: TIGR00300 family protein [Methanobacteriaceae archaeon]|nr:TIGR00300 family protein [Methanobacteriaceae archaeon]
MIYIKYHREVRLSGHIIDSLTLPNTLDTIMEEGGDFNIINFNIGKHKTDTSSARIVVSASTDEKLNRILDILNGFGVTVIDQEEVQLIACEKDKVLPDNFYSTTNYPTSVRYNEKWLPINNIEMDCVIIVDTENESATCKPIDNVKFGEQVVIGRNGVKVAPPERPRGKQHVFEFMNSEASSEKPTQTIIDQIADEIKAIKNKGGKIAVVAGPAVVHTGSAPILASLIKEDIVNVLFAGNALATHDIESALYGTSLGVCLETGELVRSGHKHHIYAINEINRAGSIGEAVENGVLKKGIMYECIKNNTPYVLAGSIRDDGPLPDVITDSVKSQNKMRELIQDVDMVIMISTMLHSIATGNLLPSRVKSICVDINPSTVTKLADRGSSQVVGIVTDIGSFLPMLYQSLHK